LEKRYQVFVSSTYADLKDERKSVIQTLLKMDCIPAGMELFPAADEDQFEFIKRIINDCDYYLLIIGGRYGSLTAQGISYTEQEYEYALERNLKVIALLHKNPDQIPFDKSEQKPKLRARLKAFREKAAKGRVVEFWQNEDELPGIVALSLINTIKMFPAVGWVRADKVSSEELLIEINELRKQNGLMKEQLAAIEPSIFSGSEDKDFSNIYAQLNRFEEIKVIVKDNGYMPLSEELYEINLSSLIVFISYTDNPEYRWSNISLIILNDVPHTKAIGNISRSLSEIKGLTKELAMYGFLSKAYVPSIPRNENFELIFSEKLERYKYWLTVNDKMPERIQIIKKE